MTREEKEMAADLLARFAMLVAIKTASDEWLAHCIEVTPCKATRKVCTETLAHRIARKAGL